MAYVKLHMIRTDKVTGLHVHNVLHNRVSREFVFSLNVGIYNLPYPVDGDRKKHYCVDLTMLTNQLKTSLIALLVM